MKKLVIMLFFMIILALFPIGCGETKSVAEIPLPQSAMNAIYALDDNESISKYIEVKSVEDRGDYYYIQIDIKYDPEIIESFGDAFSQAEIYTEAIAKSSVNIITTYGVNQDISVWAFFPIGGEEVALLGNTWYNSELKTYEWKRYKP